MKKRHFVSLISTIKESLSAHKNADWSDNKVIEIVAENITNKFAKYIKEQEDSFQKLLTDNNGSINASEDSLSGTETLTKSAPKLATLDI